MFYIDSKTDRQLRPIVRIFLGNYPQIYELVEFAIEEPVEVQQQLLQALQRAPKTVVPYGDRNDLICHMDLTEAEQILEVV